MHRSVRMFLVAVGLASLVTALERSTRADCPGIDELRAVFVREASDPKDHDWPVEIDFVQIDDGAIQVLGLDSDLYARAER